MRNTSQVVDNITETIQDIIGTEKLNTEETIEVLEQLKDWTEMSLEQIRKEIYYVKDESTTCRTN